MGLLFYHGTRAELKPGDLVQCGAHVDVAEADAAARYVYLTTNLDEAIWDAELDEGEAPGRVYTVEPMGELGNASDLPHWKSPGHPTMSRYCRGALRVVGEVVEWCFYHGTRADLKVGELIEPGHHSNYGQKTKASHVYLTRTLDAATWGAELAAGDGPGRIYVVEPTGQIEEDPELTNRRFRGNPTKSFRSREALRVIGEVTHWKGHSPEAVQAMKEGLKRLEQQGAPSADDGTT